MVVETRNAKETQELGKKFALDLKTGGNHPSVICLYGDLGSGKTTFIQGFAQGLGITKRILSPTFILMRQYSIINFYHIDLYRIEGEKDVEALGLDEIFSNPENVVAIEWPEKIESILPKKRINIKFEYLDENKRKIIIKDDWES